MVRRFIIIVFCAALLSGCNFPRPTPTTSTDEIATQVSRLLTSTPEPVINPTSVFPQMQVTATPVALASSTPTLVQPQSMPSVSPALETEQGDPRQSLGQPTATDPMDKPNLFLSNRDPGHYTAEFKDGSLVLTSMTPDGWHSWVLSFIRAQNLYVEAVFRTDTCSGLDRYGIMLRAPDPTQGYLFGVSCDGQYSFRKWDGSGFSDLIDWSPSPNINSGADQTNRIGIKAVGGRFSLYSNGALLGEVTDDSYTEGVFGVFQAASETANFTVRVDELSYWILQ